MSNIKYEFKVGQRVWFPLRSGISAFGNIVEVHLDDSSVLIREDNGMYCERLMSEVLILGEQGE